MRYILDEFKKIFGTNGHQPSVMADEPEGAEAATYRRNGYDEDAEETERVRGETQMLLRVPKRFKFRGFHRLAKRREKVKSPDVR